MEPAHTASRRIELGNDRSGDTTLRHGFENGVGTSPRLRILVVSDNAWLAIELERLLTEHGYEICTMVNSSAAAVTAAEIHQPDLVLLDLFGSGAYSSHATMLKIHRFCGIPSLSLEDAITSCTSASLRNGLLRLLPRQHHR